MLRIKAERLARKWSQTQLAARACLSTSDISRIETGRFRPYPQQTVRIARALKMSPDELLLESVETEAIAVEPVMHDGQPKGESHGG
jgi:transcriptional regulator with XRE-family HTH domain